jgi:dihydropyrimidinase
MILSKAHIINPDSSFHADILIRDGKIEAIEQPGTFHKSPKLPMIETEKMYVLPGGIDPHVHLALPTPAGPSADDFATGSRAALAGGVTHIIDFVTPRRGQSLTEALAERQKEASACSIDVSFHMGISGWLPDMERQMETCVKDHGIVSFKAYLAYRQTIGIDYVALERIMAIASRLGAIVLVHAEEGDVIESMQHKFVMEGLTHPRFHALSRLPETEINAVQKVIELVRKTDCKTYFVHISTAESAKLIADAKKEGLPLFAETCPHYLIFNDMVYDGEFEQSAPYVFSPPARKEENIESLWEHLVNGTFDTVATDHCPFSMQQKKAGLDNFTLIPNGAGSLEFRIPLLYNFGVLQKKLSPGQWVKLISSNPAEIFGLDKKGTIATGMAADLIIFNPETKTTLSAKHQYQNCDINIYEGFNVTGQVVRTYKNGNSVFDKHIDANSFKGKN